MKQGSDRESFSTLVFHQLTALVAKHSVLCCAAGIDVQNQNVHVNWQTYLELYCIFEAGQVQPSHLIRFWIKFFDQSLSGKCDKEEYLSLLEELVRGVSLPKPIETTKLFAVMFQKQMQRQGCLDENKAIITDKLAIAFEEGRLDI